MVLVFIFKSFYLSILIFNYITIEMWEYQLRLIKKIAHSLQISKSIKIFHVIITILSTTYFFESESAPQYMLW